MALNLNRIMRILSLFSLILSLFLLTGCEHNSVIINNVDEREANEIVVFLASKGIPAQKMAATSAAPGAAAAAATWNIAVDSKKATEAMSILNYNGLPRLKTTNLLQLFAKSGLMTSGTEDQIRYQAGLAAQISGMIRKIDGVIDAEVQLSFPTTSATPPAPGAAPTAPQKITAAVYVKHQGILDDPNSHLVLKIKRLVAGSVTGLDINDVTVISDRSRFTDIVLTPSVEALEQGKEQEYVSIWSIVMSKKSANRFRTIFFILIICAIVFAVALGWLAWKFYPLLKKRGGLKALMQPTPMQEEKPPEEMK